MLCNTERAFAFMRECGLEALVAVSPTNVRYFSDYTCWLDPLFKEYMVKPGGSNNPAQDLCAVLPLSGESALILPPLLAINATDLEVRDLRVYGDAGLDESLPPHNLPDPARNLLERLHQGRAYPTSVAALASVLRERGLARAPIGLEMEGLTLQQKAALIDALPDATFKDCTNLLRLIRAVKSVEEIARLQRGAEISEQAGMECFAMARPGGDWNELVEHFRVRVAESGAVLDHFSCAPYGMGIATELHYRLAADDVMYVDWGCIYRGYFSDTGTTFALKQLPPPLQERFGWVRASMDAGINAIRTGIKASAVQAAMWQALSAHGPVSSYPHGHSFGLDVRDYPILAPDNGLRLRDDCIDVSSDLPLEPDMVLNLEAPIFMPGVGSVHLEESFVVTDNGSRPLIPQERSQPVIPHA